MSEEGLDADMTLDEVAHILRRSRSTVRDMAAQGRLPGAYQEPPEPGVHWRVNRDEFTQWRQQLGRYRPNPNVIPARSRRAQMARDRHLRRKSA